ncbi:hypothetical protein [Actinoplanes utahensis]|uniref:Leucine rich repeat variant n=1 Tax=Actinoplanes utahensis TaxID=1869 RepID=A0A0A6UT08_ACTUT|nr:hypothetical protein [Actinoplanes utahensis]KHD78566.1 hypothetical protein MB27_05020 [Actinoplanes utahensis]GIF31753.1 hypothetical protein Aut01nite_47390 [Actinoplanes utahensis]
MGDWQLLHALAGNPSLPPELLTRLIATADEDLAGCLAERSDLGPAQVRELAGRSGKAMVALVRGGLMEAAEVDPGVHPYAAMTLLDDGIGRAERAKLFARDPDAKRRFDLASCPGLPPEVIALLVSDSDLAVVAESASFAADRDLLTRLAAHPHADVRAGVAGNPATPPEVLAALVTTHWPGDMPDRSAAGGGRADSTGQGNDSGGGLPESCAVCVRHPIPFAHEPDCPLLDCDLPAGAACDGTHESVVHSLLRRAVDNPVTPVEAAIRLADHPSAIVRWTLAERADLPADVAERLAADPMPAVRMAVAGSPALSEAAIRRLAGDDYGQVRRLAARNPRVPLDLLTRSAGDGPLPRIAAAGPEEVREMAGSRNPALRMLVAERRDLPPEIRDRLAADPDASVVKAIAPHPGLPAELMRQMVARHGVRVVAKVATNPDAPADLLLELARHVPPARKALREIAGHPNAPAAALEICLTDARARPIAAGHPALPAERIAELVSDLIEAGGQVSGREP